MSTAKDIGKLMAKLGEPLTDEEARAVVTELAGGPSDKVTADDFKTAAMKK